MKLIEIIIKPLTAFGTPLKGDTIFGHIFWEIIYDNKLVKKGINEIIEAYLNRNPFLITSSAFPVLNKDKNKVWYFTKPAIPLEYFSDFAYPENICNEILYLKYKDIKKASWIKSSAFQIDLSINNLETLKKDGISIFIKNKQIRNKINRILGSTSENFAPYEVENLWFHPEIKLSIFVLYNEDIINLEEIKIIFERMGISGFGRDASSGLGKFKILEINELKMPDKSQIVYALSPFVPDESLKEAEIFFNPFLKFGKHGSRFSAGDNPFKSPILMADEGAVIKSNKEVGIFVGKGISKISKICKKTIHQGYSIVIPVKGFKG